MNTPPSPTRTGDSSASSRLAAHQLRLGYGDRIVVDGLDLELRTGSITTIIGPNGCGKSTLLRALGRLLKPRAGQVTLDGVDVASLRTREVARVLSMLPQAPVSPEGLTVADLVARGRHPHQRWFRQWSSDDESTVDDALAETGVADLADRAVDELSGGQRQRVWISMSLAQGTDLLLLDEPTTYLDLAHAMEVMDLVERLRTDLGRTIVMVLHDLNMAARYSDRLIVMKDGAIVRQGPPRDVLDADMLLDVFGLNALVIDDPVGGGPLVVPIGDRHVARFPAPAAAS